MAEKKAAANWQRPLSNQPGTTSLRSPFHQEPCRLERGRGRGLRARARLRSGSLRSSRLGSGSRARLWLFDFFFAGRDGRRWLRDTGGLALRAGNLGYAAARHIAAELSVEIRQERHEKEVLIRRVQRAERSLRALLGFGQQ